MSRLRRMTEKRLSCVFRAGVVVYLVLVGALIAALVALGVPTTNPLYWLPYPVLLLWIAGYAVARRRVRRTPAGDAGGGHAPTGLRPPTDPTAAR